MLVSRASLVLICSMLMWEKREVLGKICALMVVNSQHYFRKIRLRETVFARLGPFPIAREKKTRACSSSRALL